MHIVWFKRDLRIQDHPALIAACECKDVLPLYIIEPQLWQQPDLSKRHYLFLYECLYSLDEQLRAIGSYLTVKVGDAVQVLNDLQSKYTVTALWSHQETWNGWTYQRDLAVKKWCKLNSIVWHEPRQQGVQRRLADRDVWAKQWYDYMNQKTLPAPAHICHTHNSVVSDAVPTYEELCEILDTVNNASISANNSFSINETMRQKGGRKKAEQALQTFFDSRGEHYTKAMSSPVTAYMACSRISPHISFGTISVREVFQAARNHSAAIKQRPHGTKGKWSSAMRSFSNRLRWHCHFMQKLEDEPSMEFYNLHPIYNNVREEHTLTSTQQEYLHAWKTGNTGYPLVDACMRALIATGWLNFRMRAMLMSFASYHLWLHWRETSLHLARMFVDYEPGIHYSQAQMQSGTTGINSIRAYNPIKQSQDQDPEGVFIRTWVPELADVPNEFIHTPWLYANPNDLIDNDISVLNGYPLPIVDEKKARKLATDTVFAVRKEYEYQFIAQHIIKKHAARSKHGVRAVVMAKQARKRRVKKKADTSQIQLDFDE